MPLASLACAALVGFDQFPAWTWVVQLAALALTIVLDNVVQVVGVGRAGGSRTALVGGAIGVVVGPLLLLPLGPLAVLLGPPVGAVVGTLAGERHARRRLQARGMAATSPGMMRLGVAALVAWVAATALRVVLVGTQAAVLLWRVW